MTEAQTGATGNSAQPPQVTETSAKQAELVAKVKEARVKEIASRGNTTLAEKLSAVLRDDGKPGDSVKVTDAARSEPSKETAPASTEAPPEQASEVKKDDAVDRRASRAKELADLAQKGRQKWEEARRAKQRADEDRRSKAEYEAKLAELQAEREKLAAATKNPLDFLEKSGVPPEEIAKQVLRRGTPQARVEDLEAKLEQRFKELEEKERTAKEAEQKRSEEAQRLAARQEAVRREQGFVQTASDAAKYPALNALYRPQEILQKAYELISLAREEDPEAFYEDSEIADLLEHEAGERLNTLKERFGNAPKTSESPKADEAQQAGPKPRTLVSNMQSEKVSDETAFKKLPRWKQNQILGQRLNALKAEKDTKRGAK